MSEPCFAFGVRTRLVLFDDLDLPLWSIKEFFDKLGFGEPFDYDEDDGYLQYEKKLGEFVPVENEGQWYLVYTIEDCYLEACPGASVSMKTIIDKFDIVAQKVHQHIGADLYDSADFVVYAYEWYNGSEELWI